LATAAASKLIYCNELDKSGDFEAREQPELFAEESLAALIIA